MLAQDRSALRRENVAHAHSPVPDRESCRDFQDDPDIARLAVLTPAAPPAE